MYPVYARKQAGKVSYLPCPTYCFIYLFIITHHGPRPGLLDFSQLALFLVAVDEK
jgi:hypothetical protein